MLQVKDVQKSYGQLSVLSEVSFSLGRGQKAALVGHNGTGKSTLLRIIAGMEEADGGVVKIAQDARVAYLPQDTSLVGEETVTEYIRYFSGIDELEREMEVLSSKLEDPESAKRYAYVQEKYLELDGYSFSQRMAVVLSGFGLDDAIASRKLTELSSGQKTKVALAGILLRGTDLLLLDEPTNNLDLPALIWLEDFLESSNVSCLIVSHDRRFLDTIVSKIFELDWQTHTLSATSGTYSDFIERSEKEIRRLKEEYHAQQEEIDRLTILAKDKKQATAAGSKWKGSDNDKLLRGFKREKAGKSGKAAKAIEKRIEQMDKVERPIERDPFEINLEAERLRGNLGIEVSDLVAGYPRGFKIGPVSLSVSYGDRVGIFGLNGSGKSTFLKAVTGELKPFDGQVSLGSGIKIGNMMQEHESLPRESGILDLLMQRSGLDEPHAFNKLVRFGFDRAQVRREIGTLSPGGRARFLLALFSAQSVNTLVLDEPTNHLDIEALAALEETLEVYEGTVILVSHDRYFVETANLDYIYDLSEGRLTKISDYKDYLAQAERRAKKLLRML